MKVSFLGHGEDPANILADVDISEKVSITTSFLPYAKSFFILEFSIDGDSLDAAKDLAAIRDDAHFSDCRLLDDDPSERFERDLFRQIALFERQLRKLLTISLCPQEGHLEVELITQLDRLTFGELFDALFIDKQFNNDVKRVVNNRSSLFEKQDLIQELSEIEENSLWVKTFSGVEMPSLRKSHRLLQGYRNDAMHAHRMSLGDYKEAMRLMRTVNEELSDSMEERLNWDFDTDYTQFAKNLSAAMEVLSENLRKAYDFEPFVRAIQTALKNYRFSDEEDPGDGDNIV